MALTRPSAAQLATGTVDLTDAIIRINSGETGANTSDVGIIFERGSHTNAGLIWDESADAFRFISTTNAGESTSNINISAHHSLHIGTLVSSGLTYPSVDGSAGHYLKTDGAGNLTFAAVTASPAGSDTQVQYNNAGVAGASANLTFNGTTLTANALTVTTNATITGNLTVSGTTTTINTETINLADNIITLNSNEAGIPSQNAGIEVERGTSSNVTLQWNETGDYWEIASGGTTGRILTTGDEGSGNGLDADTLDGQQGSYYLDWTNTTNKPDPTITLGGDLSGSATLTDLGNATLTATITKDTTITLTGDVTGSATMTNLGNVSITATVADDSHNHIISNVDGLQTALDAKLNSSSYTAADVLTKVKTVDGSGSGLDADTLDGVQGSSFLRSDTADTIAANYTVNSGNYLYYYHPSQTDGNDGKIGVGMFGSGLNIVGVQSSASDGRRIRMWGNITQMQGEFQGTATSAKYADLAENYLADQEYPIGTVLDIGGEKEVTIATKESYKIVGTVSEKPGFLMNSQIEGDYITPVAYIGRVPCRVEGVIERGDILIVGNTPGVAVACHPRNILPGQAIGKALESYYNMHEGLIEILVGRL